MKYTSSEANKLLRRLNEERDTLLMMEQKSSVFLAAMGEDPESVRPEYDFEKVRKTLEELDRKIRIVKHAVNRFNLEHQVAGFEMTIDQMLIYIPQLTGRKQKLAMMKNRLPKQREMGQSYGRTGNIIDYSYANYDIKAAEAAYEAVADELARAQTALDVLNNTETMEIVI
ncbi:MAG: hypothetical protein HFI38_14225 [Lachnospiraceae bacterium]|jgi:hypothetical protein|nr:hypothetical protein [Lachnospiraceae bacterium]